MIVTTVDITKDSVCDIQAKLFYQATDGKQMINAWEAPMPAALQVLSEKQAREWGSESMRCIASRVSKTPNRRGRRKVSSMARYAQRSSAEPFHGYRSEPVKAPAFKFNEPVGPVATAIKAAGELAAIAKYHGEDDEPVWDLLRGSWGVDVTEVRKYVMPDLSSSSEKDLIKFIRSPSHMLYGFNNHSPTVTISLGKYRPETMDRNYMYDWHSFSIALRFQGEYISRYQGGFSHPGQSVAYAPAYAEGSPYQKTSVTTNMQKANAPEPHDSLAAIVDVTLKHYQGEMSRFGVRTGARLNSLRAKISSDVKIDISVLNEMAAKKSRMSVHLPKNAIKVRSDKPAYDITESTSKSFQRTIASTANRYGEHYIPTWRSVHALVWELAFRMGGQKTVGAIQFLRVANTLPALEDNARAIFRDSLIDAIPVDFGDTMMTVLRIMSPTENKAVTEFFDMLSEISVGTYNARDTDWSTLYIEAACASPDISVLSGYISMGYRRVQSLVHSAGNIICGEMPGLSIHDNFTLGLSNYCTERLDHWANHYSSRVTDYRLTLKRLEAAKDDRGLSWENGLAPYPAMRNMSGDIGMYSDDAIIGFQCGCRYGTVVYAYLSRCYKASEVVFDKRFNVRVRINASRYGAMMKLVASNYVRKRSGKYKALTDIEIADVLRPIDTFSRHVDINNYLDKALEPTITWVGLYNIYLQKITSTENSIKRTLRARIDNSKEAAVACDNSEVKEMVIDTATAPNVTYDKPVSTNRYAMLAESDSSDSSSVESVLDSEVDSASECDVIDEETAEAEDATLSAALQVETEVKPSQELASDTTGLDLSAFGDMFSEDVQSVNYDNVSLREHLNSDSAIPFNDDVFAKLVDEEGAGGLDISVNVFGIQPYVDKYMMLYHGSDSKVDDILSSDAGNVDIV